MPADQEQWSEGRVDAPSAAPEGDADSGTGGRQSLWWVPGVITIATIGAVIAVTVWQLHLNLLFTNTTTTGGDTGAHIAMPKYLETLLSHGHITGWDPGWYDGFPLYTFYFTIPDLFIAIGGWIIPYDIAFKLGTVLGSVSLPICAWACGRFFRLRPPIPTIMAAVTLPFLFDYTFTIYGGNLFSTLAGEYAYSFSLSIAILFIGLFACAVREGRHRGWAAFVLAVCVLSHIVGGMYTLGGAAIITVVELLPNTWGIRDDGILRIGGGGTIVPKVPWWRTLWWAASTVLVGLLLTGVWLGPFGLEHAYSISMGYTNVEGWALYFREADTWALVLAGLGAITAVLVRSRFGICITLLGIASGLATAIDPQGSLYNVRLLPLWFISVYLMAAWAFGTAVSLWPCGGVAGGCAVGNEPLPCPRPWQMPRRLRYQTARCRPTDRASASRPSVSLRRTVDQRRAGGRLPSAGPSWDCWAHCSSSCPRSSPRWPTTSPGCTPARTRCPTGRSTTTSATRDRPRIPSTAPSC